ncbi:MAG: hypothetical protein KGN02_08110 [bacterium]|nr:hypothetical protein [bacterium]
MLAALTFLLAAATASPAPVVPAQTPPPEPNHVTLDIQGGPLVTSGNAWIGGNGTMTQLGARYEFQATPKARFANTLQWQRLASHYAFAGGPRWNFDYDQFDDEFDVELGRPDLPTGVGVGYFSYNPVYDFNETYALHGFGIGVDRWANYYMPRSYYYSAWYYPSLRGATLDYGKYAVLRLDVGVNFRPNLVGPWNLRVGFMSDTWFARNANASDSGFNGPYVGVSFWH